MNTLTMLARGEGAQSRAGRVALSPSGEAGKPLGFPRQQPPSGVPAGKAVLQNELTHFPLQSTLPLYPHLRGILHLGIISNKGQPWASQVLLTMGESVDTKVKCVIAIFSFLY